MCSDDVLGERGRHWAIPPVWAGTKGPSSSQRILPPRLDCRTGKSEAAVGAEGDRGREFGQNWKRPGEADQSAEEWCWVIQRKECETGKPAPK